MVSKADMKDRRTPMSAAQVRRTFLQYFSEQGHTVVPSSSLVPGNDPTLLFTNAGMVQFKDVFLGKDRRDYVRAASSQRCVRAGGKHNDLENVGYTARHLTFFEMLGNFSFGDYFKRDAIRFHWELVTGKDWFGIDPQRLMVTVYHTDDEAFVLWHQLIGLPRDRIVRIGDKPGGGSDNFWQMGDTGPCGPCTEIFYDHGPDIAGGPPGSPEEDGDRWVEICNLVFMQFDRDASGALTPLPKPSVDTGMGLERMTTVMQGVHSNFEIDLFRQLIQAAARAVNTQDLASNSLQVIADHIRACSFLIVDGIMPSNEGRGYVLRRIIRRAVRHGYKLGQEQPFFYKLVPALVEAMGEAFPELAGSAERVSQALRQEEERFAETLTAGMAQFDSRMRDQGGQVVPGNLVFLLHDTYGFPPDLTADIARERDLTVDMQGYERDMQAQRERARAASRFGVDLRAGTQFTERTDFLGHDAVESQGRVLALLRDGARVDALNAGERGEVILDQTAFYAESGGQVGDAGELCSTAGGRFAVDDTQKRGTAHSHSGSVTEGCLRIGDTVTARVDGVRREAVRLNHSATHLLHAALRKVLGTHVSQKGSLVAPDRLRFDFSHTQPVAPGELAQVERLVNAEIRANAEAATRVMEYEDAIAAGAMALFGEKYEKQVRVLTLGGFSTELCGGTHVKRAGDIGLFHIVSESGVAAGIRRIEAVTGQAALDYFDRIDTALVDIAQLVHGSREDAANKVRDALERVRLLERENRGLKDKLALGQGTDLAASAVSIGAAKVLAARVPDADAGALRAAVDQLKGRLGSAVIVLGSATADGKVILVSGVTSDLVGRVKAGELIGSVAAQVGGKGGGRPDFAQAGGTDPAALDKALGSVVAWVQPRLTAD
jgi:alanyl-tRNA synthetase